ncbi:MAG: DUF721 domain-containing protein [Gemmatimonadetes bacterium]|nr:DUF721 domain-containing protein [Gemmatimonadota bacterium]
MRSPRRSRAWNAGLCLRAPSHRWAQTASGVRVWRARSAGRMRKRDDGRDPERRGAPEPIGKAVGDFLRESGLVARVERANVVVRWGELVGAPIAAVTVARTITDDGTLFVGVKTHSWMTELSMMERQLVGRLNTGLGRSEDQPLVRRIRWELQR